MQKIDWIKPLDADGKNLKLPKTEAYQQSRKLSHELVISIKTSTSNPDTYYNFF